MVDISSHFWGKGSLKAKEFSAEGNNSLSLLRLVATEEVKKEKNPTLELPIYFVKTEVSGEIENV
jgi:hypothetical protein